MIEICYWEDDDQAEDLFDTLRSRGLEYKAIRLDPEIPNAQPSVTAQGKTYTDFYEFVRTLSI